MRRALELIICLTLAAGAVHANDSYYLYLHGRLAEQKGDLETARQDYEKALQGDPRAVEVLRDLAQLDLRQGRLDAALKNAKSITQLTPKSSSARLFLGNIHALRGENENALEQYRAALNIEPDNEEALTGLASFYGDQGSPKAEIYFKKFFALYDDAEMRYRYGQWLDRQKRTEDAIRELQKSVDMAPRFLSARIALAGIYEIRKSTEALRQYERCLEIEPNSPGIILRLAHLDYEHQRFDDAQRLFERGLALFPGEPSVYYWLARCHEAKREWREAEKYLVKAYRRNSDPQILPLLAYYATMGNQPSRALKWLRKACKEDPENPATLLFLGMGAYDLGKQEEAKKAFQRYLEKKPDDSQALFHLAVIEDQSGHFDRAEGLLKKIITVDPRYGAALNYLGYSYVDRGVHLSEAELLIRRAIKEEPANGAFRDSLGWAHYKQGDPVRARSELEYAVKLMADPVLYEHLAVVYETMGSTVSAVSSWQKARALDSRDKKAKKAIEAWSEQSDYTPHARPILALIAESEAHILTWTRNADIEISSGSRRTRLSGSIRFRKPANYTLHLSTAPEGEPYVIEAGSSTFVSAPALPKEFLGEVASATEALAVAFNPPWGAVLHSSAAAVQDGDHLLLRTPSEGVWLDPIAIRGVRWRSLSPSGETRFEVEWKSFDLNGDIWLPREIRIRFPSRSMEMRWVFQKSPRS